MKKKKKGKEEKQTGRKPKREVCGKGKELEHRVERGRRRRQRPVGDVDPVGEEHGVAMAGSADA